jgi:hypothetical protein
MMRRVFSTRRSLSCMPLFMYHPEDEKNRRFAEQTDEQTDEKNGQQAHG